MKLDQDRSGSGDGAAPDIARDTLGLGAAPLSSGGKVYVLSTTP